MCESTATLTNASSGKFEPYVSPKVAFALRYHQALRFYPDHTVGYEYPDLYKRMCGEDYTPPPPIEAAYKFVKSHKWYMEPRLVTVHDLYAFDNTPSPLPTAVLVVTCGSRNIYSIKICCTRALT